MKAALTASALVVFAALSAAGCGGGGGGSDVSDLQSTPWVLTSGKGITLPAGVSPSATFSESGQVSGSGGCNRYGAPYTVDGNSLSIGQIAGTQMSCSPARNTVEAAYIAALGKVTTWAKDGDELVLSDASGGELLRYKVATLVGAWTVTGLLSNNAIVSPIAGTEITASFGEDGKLAGSGGCNSYTTTHDAKDGSISIDPAAATKKLCPEPTGVMEQESAYFAALEDAKTYNLDGETAQLQNADGQKLVTFARATP